MTNIGSILRTFQIRLHLTISFFSAKCNVNRGNVIEPLTVIDKGIFKIMTNINKNFLGSPGQYLQV